MLLAALRRVLGMVRKQLRKKSPANHVLAVTTVWFSLQLLVLMRVRRLGWWLLLLNFSPAAAKTLSYPSHEDGN